MSPIGLRRKFSVDFRPPVFDRGNAAQDGPELSSVRELGDMDSRIGSRGRRRSRRREIAELRDGMMDQGATVAQIAGAIAERHRVSMLMAFRLACGLSRRDVAELYNRRWPSKSPRDEKYVGYWESWRGPGSPACAGAREPSLVVLRWLAEVYGCLVDDLIRPTDAGRAGG